VRILLSWLYDFIEWPGKGPELARILTEVGLPVASVESLPGAEGHPPDALLDVEVGSNRGDCMSHLGVAREIAAATGQPFRSVVLPAGPQEEALEEASSRIAVEVEAPDLCPAYAARVLMNVRPGAATPAWIARRLGILGQRLVNPVVDAANFVMLERGQPLHAFDRARLRGGRIVVRRSREGEGIETLDGRRRTLPAGLLVIADAERPVAVAGVMGSRETEVGPGTQEVVLESARFAPAAVRASAQALGLATDAGARFSRRVDPAEMEISSLRCMALLAEATGGAALHGAVLAGPQALSAPPRAEISLRYARLSRLLGSTVSREEVAAVLASLSIEVVSWDGEGLRARAPSWRGDLALEEDLVEEVARIRGYGKIPSGLSLTVRPVPRRREDIVAAAAREALAAAGFHEALTLPFVAPGPLDDASPWTDRPAVRVANPVRAEEPLLRRSLLGPLLRCLERNRARGVAGTRLFEIGAAFLPVAEGPRPEERRLLSGLAEGGYAEVRGAVDAVAAALGMEGRVLAERAAPEAPVRPLDPARTARLVLDGRTAGWAGEVRPGDLEGLGVHREGLRAAAFELDWGVFERAAVLDRPVREPPAHPQATRDLAVVLHLPVPWAAVEALVRSSAGTLLRSVDLFDDFRGKGIPAGSRSLAFRLVLGADDRTLRGEEVDAVVASVVGALEKSHGARLRAGPG